MPRGKPLDPLAPGDRFGRWVVVSTAEPDSRWNARSLCVCDCGTERKVKIRELSTGGSKSCGCLSAELASQRNRTHGLTETPAYQSWVHMTERGGLRPTKREDLIRRYVNRGIVVEPPLDTFEGFLSVLGERPEGCTLDRYPNPDGNYAPGNVRWATPTEQNRNRSSNRLITHKGKTLCLAEWAEGAGMSSATLTQRLRRMSIEKALSFPVRQLKQHKPQIQQLPGKDA